MNVLLINLTRFGDLLQMQPLILGLQAQGHTVGLVCLHNFAPATALIRGLSYVAPLQGATFLRSLEQSWPQALAHVEELLQDITQNFPVHMVINTTATLSARLLARRIAQSSSQNDAENVNSIPILGFGLDAHGFSVSGDMWATFLQGASAERLNCPFNLVDMFRSVAKVAHMPPLRGLENPAAPVQQAAHTLLHTTMPPSCQGFVAFQLGASEARRQWAVQHFAQVGAQLWHTHKLCPILLGSPAEQALGKAYAQQQEALSQTTQGAHPFIDIIGQTDIPHLAAVLKECKLLITNDTGTMHLAAGLHVPVLALFLATAQAWDTGPYMLNACCLEPALSCHPCAFHTPCTHVQENACEQPCLTSITPATVGHLAQHFLQHGTWPTLMQDEARIWLTQEDDTGFATLHCLSGHQEEERSHWLLLQRFFYRHILDEKILTDHIPQEHVYKLSAQLRQQAQQTLHQCTQLLLLLYENVQLLQRIPSKQTGERIINTCHTIYGLLEKCPPLKALSHLWFVLYQERAAQWESFARLILSLRTNLLAWCTALESSAVEV